MMRKLVLTMLVLTVFFGIPFPKVGHIISGRSPSSVQDASDAVDPVVEISNSKFTYQRRLACEYIRFVKAEMEKLDDQTLSAQMESSTKELQEKMKDRELPRRTRVLIKRTIKDLKRISKLKTKKENLTKVLDFACDAEKTIGGNALRFTAEMGTALSTVFFFPVRFVFGFGKGLFLGRERSAGPNHFNESLGNNAGVLGLLPLKHAITFSLLGGESPALIPFFIAPFMDQQSSNICEHPNQANSNEVRYCEHYEKFKSRFRTWVGSGEHAGVAIHDLFPKGDVCEKNHVKQVEVARNILMNRGDQLRAEHPQIASFVVIPPKEESCVSIRVNLKDERDIPELAEAVGVTLDGVNLTFAASDDPANELPVFRPKDSPEQFCLKIEQEKMAEAALPRGEDLSMKRIKMLLNPERYGSPDVTELVTSKEQLKRGTPKQNLPGRNVIFYYKPTVDQDRLWEIGKTDYEKKVSEWNDLRKELKAIARQSDLESCVSKIKAEDFDFKHYLELTETIRGNQAAAAEQMLMASKKVVNKAGRRLFGLIHTLKMDWEVVEASSHQELIDLLHHSDLENLVILSHGTATGRIVDLVQSEFPSSGFSWLSPKLRSLALYGCNSDADIPSYDLKNKLQAIETLHPVRYLVFSKGDRWFVPNEVPIESFSAYLESHDHFLFRASQGGLLSEAANSSSMPELKPEAICEMKIEGVTPKSGFFSLSVASQVLFGIYDSENLEKNFQFPCAALEKKDPVVVIMNDDLVHFRDGSLELKNPKALVKDSAGLVREWSKIQAFTRPTDGSVRGIHIRK